VLPTQSNCDQRVHWTPFEDRLAFDWAYYHYVTLQSSAAEIAEGLNLWSATSIKHGSLTGAPWKTAKEMYAAVDSIQTGALPFKTYNCHYTGPKPSTPPRWMEQTYELNTRDVLAVAREQLATPAFKEQFNYSPYQEFNNKGERVWSNLMSGHWAFKQAVRSTSYHFWDHFPLTLSYFVARTSSLNTKVTTGRCLCPSSQGATRQLFRLQQVTKNTTRSTFRSETSQILPGEHMETLFFWLPSCPYQRVSLISHSLLRSHTA